MSFSRERSGLRGSRRRKPRRPLMFAIDTAAYEAVDALLRVGANISSQNDIGRALLPHALGRNERYRLAASIRTTESTGPATAALLEYPKPANVVLLVGGAVPRSRRPQRRYSKRCTHLWPGRHSEQGRTHAICQFPEQSNSSIECRTTTAHRRSHRSTQVNCQNASSSLNS